MNVSETHYKQSGTTLKRIWPSVEHRFAGEVAEEEWRTFRERVEYHFPALFSLLVNIYGNRYDFFYYIQELMHLAARMWLARNAELKGLDASRKTDATWFQANRLIGAMCYVDRFAGDLAGLRRQIPYLSELGVNYLHLMPLFKTPAGDNDGGYAISSYREVDPRLGDMAELEELATELRHRGISLVLDFVFNHTANDHLWARLALAGDPDYQDFYRMFADRTIPDEYEKHLMSIFPDDHPGCFIYQSRIRKWVWATFNNYQWDLNYENPEVFNSMCEEMLFLANTGVEVLRLDAVAFIWKEKGTTCQNLPQAHAIIQAFNRVAAISAPALVFKSEAIVHPDEVVKYIDPGECRLSYNPQLMALLWEALATREVRLLHHALAKRFALPAQCGWVNYIRSHDDIGWTFSDDDARRLGLDPAAHRRFLNDFFTGAYTGSFASGESFQEDRITGDARIAGTAASLCGLEKAVQADDEEAVELAVRRILLMHGVIFTIGGIPLIYLGDEIGMLNDHDYGAEADHTGDSRWLHRPRFDWERSALRHDQNSPPGRIYHGLLKLIQLRQQHPVFSRSDTEIVDPGNPHVLGYFRHHDEQTALVLANFADTPQQIAGTRLRHLGMRRTFVDLVAGTAITAAQHLQLQPYQFAVLM
ncbi:MAG: alpha-glucosidase C-terminal domain-containing protein [Desulfofustis sp. PB-SRB1]|jgi:amylosucrase|nr:alpha-glucosidase C-terminal domain-containing protein [Desulfofustis sp. PB-SRB1]